MDPSANVHEVLKQGLLPFLMQKMGIHNPLGGVAHAQAQAPSGPTSSPQITPAQRPGATPQQAPPPGAAPPSTPPGAGATAPGTARVGNFAAPTPQPIADVHSLEQLLMGWSSRKQQKQQAEATNAAQALMQAIEGAKTTGDWGPAESILHDNEKLFNKVYKGWLQKAEAAKKPSKPDPDQQGFEQGVGQYLQSKQQAPPTGGAPSQLGGYILPQAGPAQAAAQTQAQTSAITSQQDLERAMRGEPTLAQKAEQDKYRALQEKYTTEIRKEALGVQKAQFEAQKANTELQLKQAEASISEKKGKMTLEEEEKKLQITNVNLDIAKARLQFTRMHPPGAPKMQQPPPAMVKQVESSDQAIAYAESVLNSRGDKGFTKEDVQMLSGLLRQAGSTALAQSLPGWMGRMTPSWLGGSGKADVQSMIDSIKAYKQGLDDTISTRYPEWKKKQEAETPEADTSTDEGGDAEGEVDADIVVDPSEMSKP
jgi:hypothetical protein